MNEVLVWLLLSTGINGAAHAVATHRTEAECEKTRSRLDLPRRAYCIPANIVVPKGGAQ